MLTRTRKEKIVENLKQSIENSRALFLTNVIGIGSNEANDLRKKVRDANGSLVVTRNTLFQRAAQGTKAESLLGGLKGPTAVAFAFEDAPGVAKALYEAGKELELVTLEKGLLQEQELSKQEVIELAKLPGRDEMLGTLLATFQAPISAFARVLNAIQEKKGSEGEQLAVSEAAPEATPAGEPAAETKTEENKEGE